MKNVEKLNEVLQKFGITYDADYGEEEAEVWVKLVLDITVEDRVFDDTPEGYTDLILVMLLQRCEEVSALIAKQRDRPAEGE